MAEMVNIALVGKGLNRCGWEPLIRFFDKKKVAYEIHSAGKSLGQKYTLGILLGCDRIIPFNDLAKARYGFVVFHSSNLPEGRGFAPIYKTIVNLMPLTQTLCFAAEEVDSGNIIAKGHYPLKGNELEAEVRDIDDHLTLLLLEDAFEMLLSGKVKGMPQNHNNATWWERRTPKDSIVEPNNRIAEIFDHLRALPTEAPAYFEYRGRTFTLRLESLSHVEPFDPEKVTIERYYDS